MLYSGSAVRIAGRGAKQLGANKVTVAYQMNAARLEMICADFLAGAGLESHGSQIGVRAQISRDPAALAVPAL
jgi:hypothetical protein